MQLRMLVVVGLVGFVGFFSSQATAQQAVQSSGFALEGVSFTDSTRILERATPRFQVTPSSTTRFDGFTPGAQRAGADADRSFELAIVARAPAGMDLALAQSGGVGFDSSGDIARQRRGAELRLGRGLDMPRADRPSSTPRWYFFAASEDEALVWTPGARPSPFVGGAGPAFALQDRVEIGDIQAGVTYEVFGVQASLAYVEREISVTSGARTVSQDEQFAGVTLTMRR